MSNPESNLALPDNAPAYLEHYLKPAEENASLFGKMDAADIGTTFLKLVHQSSREAIAGWDDEKKAPAIPFGTMFLSRDHAIIPPDTTIVLLLRTKRFIKWEGKPGEGKVVATANERTDPQIVNENGLAFGSNKNTGETIKPAWTEYTNFYLAMQQCKEPVMLSFYRTSLPEGRKLTQTLMRASSGFKLPPYVLKFKLRTPTTETRGMNTWPKMNVQPDGFVAEELLGHLKKLFNAACIMHTASTGSEYVANPAGGGKTPADLKDAAPQEAEASQAAQVDAEMTPEPVFPAGSTVEKPADTIVTPTVVPQPVAPEAAQQGAAPQPQSDEAQVW